VDEPVVVGVLALQGGFAAHAKVLRELGAEVREVRTRPTSTASTGSSCRVASRRR
jgi:glutamine amidotransferase PdxT